MTIPKEESVDLRLTPDQEQFRHEVCGLLCEESVQAEAARAFRLPPNEEPGLLDVYRRLGERGWLAVNWPVEYGGLGKTLVEKAILTEEMIAHGVPELVHILSIDIVGLALSMFGTPDQKRRWLPRLASGEGAACVLLSEPDTGSDLSALATRAEPEGDGWRLRGRKMYNMKAHVADFGLCAARTTESDARYHGITVFIVPLRTPGVVIEPLWSMVDERFGDITLAGPLMTAADVLGDVDEGWHVLGQVLALERTGIELEAKGRRLLDALVAQASHDGTLADSPYGEHLVELDALVRAGQLLSWRALGTVADGAADTTLCAMAKWHVSETARSVAALSSDVCGLAAALSARDEDAPPGWVVESGYRDAPGFTLASGTSQMMLSLIASVALGLPT